ncbi:MAG: hypothetical protein LBG90_04385 [Spirochaetaceae bacterium]|jgi:hypothetical protein|nr:hypothetical protein [Spirochaetaceae bacterium]
MLKKFRSFPFFSIRRNVSSLAPALLLTALAVTGCPQNIPDPVPETETEIRPLTPEEMNAIDFGPGGTLEPELFVTNLTTWNSAKSLIASGGNNKNYIVNVSGRVTGIAPVPYQGTFGTVTGLTVSFRGDGTLSLGSNGRLLDIRAKQTVILRGPSLEGKTGNEDPLVHIFGGGYGQNATFKLIEGNIQGNANTLGSGGAVYVNSWGVFTMSGGSIHGNSQISSLTVAGQGFGGGIYISGGGWQYAGGSFSKTGGTIYGNNAGVKSNAAYANRQGHAVFLSGLTDDGQNYKKYIDATIGPEVNVFVRRHVLSETISYVGGVRTITNQVTGPRAEGAPWLNY